MEQETRKVYYRQCVLEKVVDSKNLIDTCWIPLEFAKLNKVLRIKDDDGWKVTFIGDIKTERETLVRRDDYRTQRKASDI